MAAEKDIPETTLRATTFNCTSLMKPTLIIFSSGKSRSVADGIRRNLSDTFAVDVWHEGFFDEYNTIPLWVFLKKLMCYDCSAVVLGDDDVRRKEGSVTEESVPRDNVIFELGATMARLGPQRTFIFTPQSRKVTLPSYFKGVMLWPYEDQPDARGSYQSATGEACSSIKRHLKTLNEDAFHSDLPAQGLAVGYFNNFIERLYRGLREPQELDLPSSLPWIQDCGFTITVLVPDDILNREAADRMLKEMNTANVKATLIRDRDMSVYALPRLSRSDPLHILDIPTTLLTATKVIEKIDSFWGNQGDTHFQQQLQKRELLSFFRKLKSMRKEAQLDERVVHVLPLSEWSDHVKQLAATSPPIL